MEYWHDILKGYDDLEDKDSETKNHGTYSQSSAVILLLYLAFGEDYPYNIKKFFVDKSRTYVSGYYYEYPDDPTREVRNKPYASSLKTNKIYTLLNKMRDDGLVLAKEGAGKTRSKKIYSINPRVLQSPIRQGTYLGCDGSAFEIPLEIVEQILPLKNKQWIESISYTAREGFFNNVIFERNINFFTFIRIIEDWISMERKSFIDITPLEKILNDYWCELDYLMGVYIYGVPYIADLSSVKRSMKAYKLNFDKKDVP